MLRPPLVAVAAAGSPMAMPFLGPPMTSQLCELRLDWVGVQSENCPFMLVSGLKIVQISSLNADILVYFWKYLHYGAPSTARALRGLAVGAFKPNGATTAVPHCTVGQ